SVAVARAGWMSQSAIAVLTLTDADGSGRNCTFMASSPSSFGASSLPKTGFHFARTRPFGSGSCRDRRLAEAAIGRERVVDHDLADKIRRNSLRQHRVAVELPVRIVGRE